MQTGNDPRMSKLRKYESILVISGLGVIAFGLWSVIRAGIFYFLNPLDLTDYLDQAEIDEMVMEGQTNGVEVITDNMDVVLTVLIFIGLSLDLLLRVYVGLSARAYGRGRRRRGFYSILVWIMAFFVLAGICVTIDQYLHPIVTVISTHDPNDLEWSAKRGDQAASVSLLVDLTSFLVLLELGISSFKVKRLRKQLGIRPDKKQHKKRHRKELQELSDEVSHQLRNSISTIMGD